MLVKSAASSFRALSLFGGPGVLPASCAHTQPRRTPRLRPVGSLEAFAEPIQNGAGVEAPFNLHQPSVSCIQSGGETETRALLTGTAIVTPGHHPTNDPHPIFPIAQLFDLEHTRPILPCQVNAMST
jgi:hypothetical protein